MNRALAIWIRSPRISRRPFRAVESASAVCSGSLFSGVGVRFKYGLVPAGGRFLESGPNPLGVRRCGRAIWKEFHLGFK